LLKETDFMEESINQRKNDINNIEKIMTDINSLAKDLAVETQKQGESLNRLDENITHAQVNTKVALEELTEAQVH
jgi:t-SNARE complex subunit (syntaxin)